ncbi:metal dependent phosphohydrolase [Spirochaeta thermophila DSM 6578]|uniref:bis(5'-nucleosyl)-tetraphosphatase (symmetrical) n=1 Tax=Winmispira thermophila (strain ATCC 700085 / DSM 6578 / Z-1203) TaxID=869211 RepID=G0GDI1_WINT7|nr:bis(5'-nucleosyl)-tetraphosphatase (symmetrical) YqeK [Spirochaeta thermophila]AEJ61328.1 metal dependent phosphohydrolase [Spirochaeta thermophila DSM 6578]
MREVHGGLKRLVGPARYRHSLRVATLCREIARREGVSIVSAHVAGLSHDLARDLPRDVLVAFVPCLEDVGKHEVEHPVLLHGAVAAHLLAHVYGLPIPEILEAVRHHTLGAPGLGPLGQILFCADYLEPQRTHISREEAGRILSLPLPDMVCAVVEHMERSGFPVHPVTMEMYRALREERVNAHV